MVALACQRPPAETPPTPSVADALRQHAPDYLQRHAVRPYEARTLQQLMQCRTGALGGHLWQCDDCAEKHYRYHSCRHLQCPTCARFAKADWLERMLGSQLPIGYSHVVFTLPHDLLPVVLANPRLAYALLFDSAWGAMSRCALAQHGLTIAVVMTLHTWGQRVNAHPHVHIILCLGGLTGKTGQWVPFDRPHDLIGAGDLQARFRALYLNGLERHFTKRELELPASVLEFGQTAAGFETFLAPAAAKDWIVNLQTPPDRCQGADAALKYLAGYVTGSPIGNSRIQEVTRDTVTFTFKDYRNGCERKSETISGEEFVRRFVLHILPPRFHRVRHRGFLGGPVRNERIAHIRTILGAPESTLTDEEDNVDTPTDENAMEENAEPEERTPRCPHCGSEELIHLAELPRMFGFVARRAEDFEKLAAAAPVAPLARPP